MKSLFSFVIFSLFSINTLLAMDSQYLPSNIDLHGDVRTRWTSEWSDKSENFLKTEANLGCDYYFPETWVSVKMKAATSNGKESMIYLDKAFLGYNFFRNEYGSLSVEIGRNKMESMFDSKMQYDSYFNGCHIVYTYFDPELIDFCLHGGPHVVSSTDNHYGWVVEGVWHGIAHTPLTLKYSFTDWNRPKDEKYRYAISQITAQIVSAHTTIYGAYLYNHQEEKYNDGFYVGFTAGKIIVAKDFLFDVNIQSTKGHTVSPIDFKGLRKGVNVKIVYAVTDALCLEGKFALRDAFNNKKLEISAIYSW